VPDGVCSKCGFKAPAGLLKCPFCKIYIRTPGSSSSTDITLSRPIGAAAAAPSDEAPLPESSGGGIPVPALDPSLPPPDAKVVELVQRALARELFDDSNYQWDVKEIRREDEAMKKDAAPDEKTEDGEPPS
jgi:hypothetical protein